MAQLIIEQALETALQHHREGLLPQAETLYRQILAHNPNHADALHLLGILASQFNRHDAALDLIRRSIAQRPNFPDAHYNLGTTLFQAAEFDAAIAAYRQAIALRPSYFEAHGNLGNALFKKGEMDAAIAAYRQAIAINPNYPEAHCNLGNALFEKGEMDAAIAACRQAIALRPDYPEAHSNLGNALHAAGEVDAAIAAYRHAIALRPTYHEAHSNLGNALLENGEVDAAIAACRLSISLRPDYAKAHSNLANALCEKGKWDEAIAACRQAIALQPTLAVAYMNLGNAWKHKGELDAAIAAYRQAIALQPGYPQAHSNLGAALCDVGNPDAAITAYQRAIALRPNFPGAYCNLGNALSEKGEFDEAIAAYRQAIALKPDYCEAHNYQGLVLWHKGDLDAAIAAYRQAIALRPDYSDAYNNLGNALKDAGQVEEALPCFRHAMELNPNWPQNHSNLVYTLHFHPGHDAESIYHEHVKWNQQHAEPLRELIQPHHNSRDPDRRLKIGYVSPNFQRHPVGRFLLPLLESHDHRQMEIFCYASQRAHDDVTDRLRRHADVWRAVRGLSDSQLAEQIRADQIDLLVDLALHMGGSRLLVFARKPAPVQVSWLGYPGTTGLTAIDYRITDPHMDPPGMNDAFYSEQCVRLPDITACYRPIDPTPPANALPALTAGYVTFGCLNNFCKVTDATLAAWVRILRGAPQSRLMLHAREGAHRQRARDRIAREGLNPDRVNFVGFGGAQYFEFFHRMDIALDPFPYGGGTTTCESLWMGVPVVSLAGTAGFTRLGLATLSCIGLPEFATFSQDAYVEKAIDWASDLPRLAELRSTLRAKVQASPLMDASRFARNMEAAYRTMWRKWCMAGC